MAFQGMDNESHYLIYDISGDLSETVKDSTDPYATFQLGEHSTKTEVAKNAGSNPAWTGEQYKLRKHHGNEYSSLTVSVYAKHMLLPDGLIGRGEVPLTNLVGNPQRVRLMNKKGEDMGELLFQVRGEGGAFDSQRDTTGMAAGMGAGVGSNSTRDTNTTDYNTRGTTGGTTGLNRGAYDDETTRTTTTTTTTQEPVNVCDRQVFTTEEDRPIVKEQKIFTKEHHNFEKQYKVETKFIGERKLAPGHVEALGVEEHIVETTPAAPPCADAPAIGQQALGSARNNPSY